VYNALPPTSRLRPALIALLLFFAASARLLPGQAQHGPSASSMITVGDSQDRPKHRPVERAATSQNALPIEGGLERGEHESHADMTAVETRGPSAADGGQSTGMTGETFAFVTAPHTQSAGLIINATFDSSITANPNSATIQSMINQAIGVLESQLSDPITVNVLFRYSTTAPDGSPLSANTIGRSTYAGYNVSWSSFVGALTADAKTANDSAAIASLPASPLSALVVPSSANGRALGLDTPPAVFPDGHIGPGGPYDGIITLNSSAPLQFNRSGGISPSNFDAQRTTEHELDEVLGLGSFLDHGSGNLRPQDLFSWSSSGVRNLTTSGSRYFSINRGTTNIVGFNQQPNNDFGDWLSGPCPQTTPYVQNAISCPGQFSDVSATSPEGINLDVIGYDLGSGSGCSVSISPTGQSFPASGGTGTINVMTASSCHWTASSGASWITITSGSSGTGNGALSYSIAQNSATSSRTGNLSVSGQSFTVTQSGSGGGGQLVELSVDDGSFEKDVGLTGGGTIYGVNRLTPASYPATLSQLKIFFDSGTGVNAGSPITLLAGANPGGGTDISGLSFQRTSATVTAPAAFNIYNLPNLTINSGDFVVGFQMSTGPNVFPIAEDADSQLRRRSYVSSDGVTFSIIDDAQASLAGNFGIRAEVLQGGGSCSLSIAPAAQSFPASGGAGSVSITASPGCVWTASSSAPWITITSAASGTGNGSVNYSVSQNTDTSSRTGTISISGQVLTVNQSAGAGGGSFVQLSVDDGSFEFGTTLTGASTVYGVNRFTPDHYPATLSQVQIFFGSQLGLSSGEGISLLVGVNPGGGTGLVDTNFQFFDANIGTLGAFSTYTVPNLTINSGDFVVGFRIAAGPNVFPFSEDTDAQPQRRSYISSDGLNFLLIDSLQGAHAGNFGIRAEVSEPGAGGTIPSIANLSGDLEGRVLTLTGTAYDGGADMFEYEITLRDLSSQTIGDTGPQPINFGSSTASYFTLRINNMNSVPSAVSATVVIIDRQNHRSSAASAPFGDSDPGGPGISNVGFGDFGPMTIRGGPFFGNLQLEINGDIMAPPPNIRVKGGGTKLKIAGSPSDFNMFSGPNRVRILADNFKSNIFILTL
jgi:hypothetical protein